MLGLIYFGVLGACVVLFVPMAMGWHLSRHKMLLFTAALFISLTVCVHLSPYFPSVSDIVSSVSSVVYDHRSSCINLVNEIAWDVMPKPAAESIDTNGSKLDHSGDSQARCLAISLLSLVLGSDSEAMEMVKTDLFKRHSDYNILIKEIGMKLDFVWAPYETNLTDLVIVYKNTLMF